MRARLLRPAVVIATVGAMIAATSTVLAPVANADATVPDCSGGICRVTITPTDTAASFEIPLEVSRVDLIVKGAAGGDAGLATGGMGAINTSRLDVEPGNVFTVVVGRAGAPGGATTYGGGGAAGSSVEDSGVVAASGGGGSYVYLDGSAISVAGGGGGGVDNGNEDYFNGGNAGIHQSTAGSGNGPDSTTVPTGAANLEPGLGGTTGTATGADGTASTVHSIVGQGGDGGNGTADADGSAAGGGGGGGGYAGGGGGAPGQSGAGGSSFFVSTLGGSSQTDSQGNDGDGSVTFAYTDPQAVTGTTLEVSPTGRLTTTSDVRLTARVSARSGSADGTVTFQDISAGTDIAGCVAVPVVDASAECGSVSLRQAGEHRVRAAFTSSSGQLDSQSPSLRFTVAAVPAITTSTLPGGSVGVEYSHQLGAAGSTEPYTFEKTGGTLPLGLVVQPNGLITGTPTTASDRPASFTVTVTDSQSPTQSAPKSFTLSIAKAGPGEPDFTLTPDAPVVGGSYLISASPGYPGAQLTLAGNDNCRVTDRTVTFVHTGACTVTATQAGDANHEPAAPIVKSVTVGQGTPSVSVALSAGSGAVYGQPITATATASVPGTVTFTLDGVPFGAATGPGVPAVVPALSAGPHTIGAQFTPTQQDWTSSNSSTSVSVTAASSVTTVAATPTSLRATVAVSAPSLAQPVGEVFFAVDGKPVGAAELVDGVATLDYTVAPGARTLSARYSGHQNDISPSTGTGSRTDPTITAVVTGAAKSRFGWYAAPVTVTFTCRPGSAAIVACPSPVTVTDNGTRTVTGTATASDGGSAVLGVPVSVDRTAPKAPVVAGVVAGRIYPGAIPAGGCASTDAVSGVASCTVVRSISGITLTYTATATDRAGNISRTVVRAARSIVLISGADYRGAAPVVRGGKRYALVVTGAARPNLVTPVLAPGRPTKVGAAFVKAGVNRWTLAVTFPKANAKRPMWNLGIRVGSAITVVPVKLVR